MGGPATASLTDLVDAGLLSVGERLHSSLVDRYSGIRKHFEAELVAGETVRIIDDGGDGSLNGKEFHGGSRAITALYGRPDSGWRNWTVKRVGEHVTLESIRQAQDLAEARHEKPVLTSINQPEVSRHSRASSVDPEISAKARRARTARADL